MTLSLKTKVTLFIAAAVIVASAVSTTLSLRAHWRSVDREVEARGIALAEALARAVDGSLAAENLNLIKQVEDIVHTSDVVLTQVFSPIWLAEGAVPVEQLDLPPAPEAVEYFLSRPPGGPDHFIHRDGPWTDIYNEVVLDTHDPRIDRRIMIGYVRLRISPERTTSLVAESLSTNIIAAVLLTAFTIFLLNSLIHRYLLRPLLDLHRSVSRHREGELPDPVPVTGRDEIGELSAEFNHMLAAVGDRERQLAEEKERLSVTLRSIGDGVIVTDTSCAITLMNKMAELHTGWPSEKAAGRPIDEVLRLTDERTGEPRPSPAGEAIRTGGIVGLPERTTLTRRNGSIIFVEDSAAPVRDRESRIIGTVTVFRDVTEERRVKEELIKAEKLQSVGILAGGLAHDFNNLLTSIMGNISLARMYLPPDDRAAERLTEAESASRRATELTRQLLTFSRGGDPVKQTASIAEIVRESSRFTLAGASVAADLKIPADAWTVDVDAGQMNQVFNNLFINAVHAMPGGGRVTVTVENTVLGDADIPTLTGGAYVRIAVADTGTGIPEEHLARIFDPYFTTKQQGSGLGLASVYSIMRKHGGHITVHSRPGEGTQFTLYLPATPGKQAASRAAETDIHRGQGRILVMDDEKIVRDIAGAMLAELGYEVGFAADGREALKQYCLARKSGMPYRAVIMDLTIPGGVGGREALQLLLSEDPGARAIVSSGYSNDPVMANYRQYGFRGMIVKPYSMTAFCKTLREVLEQ